MLYLDSSALVKLVVEEPESRTLRRFLRRDSVRVSCALVRTELLRAVRAHGQPAIERARRLLRGIHLIRLDDTLLDAAGLLDARIVRSLDAVHLAAAQQIAPELSALITYDRRMASAASLLGFRVAAPTIAASTSSPG